MAGKVAILLIVLMTFALVSLPLRAVQNVYSTSTPYNESTPSGTLTPPNWTTGWTQPQTQPTGYTTTTGWNYVGSVNGTMAQASGVYLGNNWVITCGHVGPGDFTLNGTVYHYLPNSEITFGTGTTTAPLDIIMFKISPAPALPELSIRSTDPVVGSSQVVMFGYGDGDTLSNETWGSDNLNAYINKSTAVNQFVTNDFWIGNNNNSQDGGIALYQVVSGDSGGGDFIYNATAKHWELAGLNEAVLQDNNGADAGSACVQLDTYRSRIELYLDPPTDMPALPPLGLVALGALLIAVTIPSILLERK